MYKSFLAMLASNSFDGLVVKATWKRPSDFEECESVQRLHGVKSARAFGAFLDEVEVWKFSVEVM